MKAADGRQKRRSGVRNPIKAADLERHDDIVLFLSHSMQVMKVIREFPSIALRGITMEKNFSVID